MTKKARRVLRNWRLPSYCTFDTAAVEGVEKARVKGFKIGRARGKRLTENRTKNPHEVKCEIQPVKQSENSGYQPNACSKIIYLG